jgi:hypothetical protein
MIHRVLDARRHLPIGSHTIGIKNANGHDLDTRRFGHNDAGDMGAVTDEFIHLTVAGVIEAIAAIVDIIRHAHEIVSSRNGAIQ